VKVLATVKGFIPKRNKPVERISRKNDRQRNEMWQQNKRDNNVEAEENAASFAIK